MFKRFKAIVMVSSAVIALVGAQAPSMLHPTPAHACGPSVATPQLSLLTGGGSSSIEADTYFYCFNGQQVYTMFHPTTSNAQYKYYSGAEFGSGGDFVAFQGYATSNVQWYVQSCTTAYSPPTGCSAFNTITT
jgi:hypothetical protein